MSDNGPKAASPAYCCPFSSFFGLAVYVYWKAIASTSGDRSARALANQPTNHFAFSAPLLHSCGASRTQYSVVSFAWVNRTSVKVRAGPFRWTVREPSVMVAMTLPAASRSSVRAGSTARRTR
jgi:hypothetical protein